jgi:putative ATP-dependent endonuclease of OLD family
MKISQLSISKYRVFDRKVTIPLSNFTVLTGPNNLGKSTVLRALDLLFSPRRRRAYGMQYVRRRTGYRIDDDYPKRYQGRPGRRWPTRIEARLELSPEDKQAASQEFDFDIPDFVELALEYRMEKHRDILRPHYELKGFTADQGQQEFLHWTTEKFSYVYIPATRNVDDFRRSIFAQLVEGAIQRVSQSRQRISDIRRFYNDARQQITVVEETLAEELRAFLPTVDSIQFVIGDLDLDRLITVHDVEIDDGAQTSLQQKGDGFKSLFAISMLQFIARQRFGQNLIFGIEEPEAHLHSSAVYEVKETLRELSQSFQILITTHSPILIQRDDLRSNIIVQDAKGQGFASSAKPARKLSDIRQSLGIRPQDNLTTAEVVIVVEGLTEESCLGSLIASISSELSGAISSGRVRVLSANGASNVLAMVRALARDAANCIVLLDSDKEGDDAATTVANSGLVDPKDLFQVSRRKGCQETEFEDVFDPKLYLDEVSSTCGITITPEMLATARQQSGGRKTRMRKWSDVMAVLVSDCGKDWDTVCDPAKEAFGTAIANNAAKIDAKSMPWLKSIASRVRAYLAEG